MTKSRSERGAHLSLSFVLLIAMPAFAADTYETTNRGIHKFNELLDRKVLKPLATGYSAVLPQPIRSSIGNVFANLEDVGDVVNNFLQGKPVHSMSDLLRVTVNSSIGIGGIFDPASKMGLINHQEDFGQTLGRWGVSPGPYIVFPLLGPNTVRDLFAKPFDSRLDGLRYLEPVGHRNSLYALRLLHRRADFLSAERAIFGDRYLFIREAYLQRREYLEKDGEVSDPFTDDF